MGALSFLSCLLAFLTALFPPAHRQEKKDYCGRSLSARVKKRKSDEKERERYIGDKDPRRGQNMDMD
jgi:hypothetical protein